MKKIYPFLFYLLYFGANAFFLPYIVLYYQSLGFTGTQIGLLSAISPLISLVGAPFWTGIADSSRRHKLVMGFTLLSVVALANFYPFVETIGVVFVLVSLHAFMVSPINSFADSATMTMLADKREMYGRIRSGGTIGWGVLAPVAGFAIQRFGLDLAFWSYASILFLGFIVSLQFSYGSVQHKISVWGGLRDLLSNRRMVLFLATTFVAGMSLMTINSYLGAYLAELGFASSVLGLALAISTISELPVLFFGNRLLARLKPHGLLILSLSAMTVRLFLFAYANSEAGILWFQLINGLTFATLWISGVSYVNENAPVGLSSTAQAVFGAAVFGFGSAGGGFIGGILLERVGGANMFAVFGALTFLMLIVYILLERRIPRPQPVG